MKIGIIGAMETEVETLKEHMREAKSVTRAGMTFVEGVLSGVPAVVVKCGIGKVNAAMCVQILADLFDVTHIINTGIAGSLTNRLDIGDILVSSVAMQHDMDVTIFGYAPGQVPGLPGTELAADPGLMELAQKAGLELKGAGAEYEDLHLICGRVVSGDQFISSAEKKDWLIDQFAGDCCEMEGASIAQASFLNGLPFVILRAISDKADGSAEMDYPTFENLSAKRCAGLVEKMLCIAAKC